MKFIVDAQMPPSLAAWIRAQGHEAAALREIGLRDAADVDIWAYTCANRCVLITKDEDFPLLAEARPGPPIIWVRTGNLLNRVTLQRFAQVWPELLQHVEAGIAVIELR